MTERIYIEAEHTGLMVGPAGRTRPRHMRGTILARNVQRLRDAGWTILTEEPETDLQQRLVAAETRHDALIDTLVTRGQLPALEADELRRRPARQQGTIEP